jgi:hypothetical protein
MAATCSICRREDRSAIEQSHVAGMSLRAIAALHAGTSPWSLRRHFAHMPALIAAVTERQVERNKSTARLPGRIEILISELERMTANALRRQDYSSALRSITARLQALRTVGELSGELRNGPRVGELVPGMNVSSAAPAPADSKEARARLMQLIAEVYGLPWPRPSKADLESNKPN